MSQIQLFISCVTDEFGNYRSPLEAKLRRPNVTVEIQEHFIASGTVLLDKLDEYIRSCQAVIHFAGDRTGSMLDEASITFIREHYPDLEARLPALKGILEDESVISYTQWEAYLALYYKINLFIVAPEPGAIRDGRYVFNAAEQQLQQEHLERLRLLGQYPEIKFRSIDGLLVDVMRSKLQDLVAKAGGKKVIHLPYQSLGHLFKGRQVFMKDLHDSLHQTDTASAAAIVGKALYGLGGIGKTRLAVEYAWRHEPEYIALLLAVADRPANLHRNLAGLCDPLILNLPEQKALEEEVKVAAVLQWLQQHTGWLLILDNVDTPGAKKAVEALLPKLHGGYVIITSRQPDWSKQVQPMELDVLQEDEAIAFLVERTKDRRRKAADDQVVARKIVQELGQLALALEQAGAYIEKRRIRLADYLVVWQGQHDKVLDWFDADVMQYPKSVAVTWQTSFDQLGEEAKRLLNRLAWLAPDVIPESSLDVPIKVEPTFDIREALAELESYSLINYSEDPAGFTVHRLVQDVARRRMHKEEKQQFLQDALEWLNDSFVGDPQDIRSWPVLDPLFPHAMSVTKYSDSIGNPRLTSRLLNQLGQLLDAKAQLKEAEPLMRRALAIDDQSLAPEDPVVAVYLANLAALLFATNQLQEAEQLIRRALDINEQSFGPEDSKVALILNNLAQLLAATNRQQEAEILMRRALAIEEKSFGSEHSYVARDLSNLAALLYNTNRLQEAEPLMKRALEIDVKNFGPEHPYVALRLNNLAQLFQDTNRQKEAEQLMRQALAIDEESFGPEHPNVARDLGNLAVLLYDTNRLQEAEPLMRRHLTILLESTKKAGHQTPLLEVGIRTYWTFLAQMGIEEQEIDARIAALIESHS